MRAQNKSANKTGKQNKPQDRNETSETEKSRDETMTSSSAFPVAAKSFASFLFFFVWLETETETWLKARYEYFSRCEQLVRVGRVLKLSSPFERNKKQKNKKKKKNKPEKKNKKGQLQTATKPNPPQQPTKVASPNERVQQQQQQQVLNKPQKK